MKEKNHSREMPNINVVEKLKELYLSGWIKTLRSGDTGIGYTLETSLDIDENNVGEPDFSFEGIQIELKAQRIKASSRVTLITKTPKWDPLPQKEIIERFGYKDKAGRQGLKITLTADKYNPKGFKLEINKEKNRINIIHKTFGVVAYYNIEELMNNIKKKIYKNLLFVLADTKKVDKKEHFRFEKAILLQDLSEEKFEKMIKKGIIVWEFRSHIKPSGIVRDHGPGFRISSLYIKDLYTKQKVIFDGSKLSEEQK